MLSRKMAFAASRPLLLLSLSEIESTVVLSYDPCYDLETMRAIAS